jgi:hypothetical protein
MEWSGPSRAIQFLYGPAPPPPTVWALKPPSWAHVHKTTYAPMIYKALCIIFGMRAYPLLGKWEGVGPLKSRVFWAPYGTRLSPLMPFHRAQKILDSMAQPPSHLPSKWICTHPKLYARGCINHRCKNSYYTVSLSLKIQIFS